MKSLLIFVASFLPASVLSSAAAYPEPTYQETDQRGPAAGIIAGLEVVGILGLLGSLSKDHNSQGACPCPATVSSCQGTPCECTNERAIGCWAAKNGQCRIDIKNCSNAREPNNLPTARGGKFPSCGLPGLAECGNNRICKYLDVKTCPKGACLGICVPFLNQPHSPAKLPPPGWAHQPARPLPSTVNPEEATLCPPNFNCPEPSICATDPRGTGDSFMCVIPNEICGGFRNDPCFNGKICLRDPRINCDGEGCTGICV